MTDDLSSYRSRVLAALGDPAGSRYSSAQVDDALRRALAEYSQASPALFETTLSVESPGRMQPVSGLLGLQFFTRVAWPDPEIPIYTWYALQVAGVPYIHFTTARIPQAGESIRLMYAAKHTLSELDGAESGTVPEAHASLLAAGAAAFAAVARSSGVTEQMTSRASNAGQLLLWGQENLKTWRSALRELALQKSGPLAAASRWRLDRWDRRPAGEEESCEPV